MERKTNNSIQYNGMLLGTYLGLFWILKFPFFPLGLRYPVFFLVFTALTILSPFLAYYLARLYRERVCGGTIRFVNAWFLLLLMYIFASILVAVAHYIYFRFFDNGFIISTYASMIDTMKNNPMFPKEYFSSAQLILSDFDSLSPIKIAFQLISQNVFYGNLLALVTALFIMKKPKNNEYLNHNSSL